MVKNWTIDTSHSLYHTIVTVAYVELMVALDTLQKNGP